MSVGWVVEAANGVAGTHLEIEIGLAAWSIPTLDQTIVLKALEDMVFIGPLLHAHAVTGVRCGGVVCEDSVSPRLVEGLNGPGFRIAHRPCKGRGGYQAEDQSR